MALEVAGEEPIAANVATPAAANNNEQNRRRNGNGVNVSGRAITAHTTSPRTKVTDRLSALQILVDVASSPLSKILTGAYKNFANLLQTATQWLSWANEDKEMVILINHIFLPFLRSLLSASIVSRNVDRVRSV